MGACCCPQTLIRDMAVQLPPSPSSNRYIHKDYLSEGGHGKVYKVYDDYAKCFVSCKETSQSKKNRAQREANILKQFNSPILPTFIDIQFKDEVNCLYYIFIPGSDLFTYLFENNKSFNTQYIKVLIKKMLNCLDELRKYNFIHLDIKFENFVFTESTNTLTLIDFEGAHLYPNDNEFKPLKTYVGTRAFTAPETWGKLYHSTSDIWSIGVCIWCIFTGERPFKVKRINRKSSCLMNQICKQLKFPQIRHIEKMKELNMDEDLTDLFHRMFQFDAKQRININQLQDHKWLKL